MFGLTLIVKVGLKGWYLIGTGLSKVPGGFKAISDTIESSRNQIDWSNDDYYYFEDFGPNTGLEIGGLGPKAKNKSWSIGVLGFSPNRICQL